jgi:hypothetical protein
VVAGIHLVVHIAVVGLEMAGAHDVVDAEVEASLIV